MVFRKEPFFYGHDNYDQLVKIAKVAPAFLRTLSISCMNRLSPICCFRPEAPVFCGPCSLL